MAGLATRILERALEAAVPGGRVIYSTCTISRAENEGVVAAAGGAARIENLGERFPPLASPHDSRFLQTRPDRDGTDGFFIARLRK